MSRPSALSLVAAVSVSLALAAPVAAQGPQKFENLQYFPKDIPRDSLLQHMRGFTAALGVKCAFCHVTEQTPNGQERLRPALDDKPEKKKARFMLHMVDTVNTTLLAALPGRSDPPVRVQCVTCHRGLTKPATLAGVLTTTIDKQGVDSAVAQYRRLRQTAMEAGTYDFSEGSLSGLAQRLAASGKASDALAMLALNQEFNPSSPGIDFQMAEIYRQQGDRDKAITRYRMVLQKDPNNQQAKRRLGELGAPVTG